MKKILVLIPVCLLLFLSTTRAQLSQTQTSLGVNPVIVEAILDEGVPLEREIEVANLSNLPIPIKVLKQSFTTKEKLELSDEQLQQFDASSWISLTSQNSDFILQPSEVRKIKFTITQPKDAAPGGHYASLILEPLVPQEIISQQSVYIYARVAVLLFLQTKGDIVQNLELTNYDHKLIFDDNHLGFDVILKNNGNTHLQPTGKINIFDDLSGQLLTSATLPSSLILPGTEKTYHIDLTAGGYTGKYSTEAIINYGTEGQVITSKRAVYYIFPYRLGIFLLLPILVIAFLVFRFRNRLYRAYKVLVYDAYQPLEKVSNSKLAKKIQFYLKRR